MASLRSGCLVLLATGLFAPPAAAAEREQLFTGKLDVNVPHISTDKSVRYDYDIVYVRARRAGDKVHKRFYTDFSAPVTMEPGADLMLLHADGKEEPLVAGGDGSITDPFVSFDGQWVYYVHIYNLQRASQWEPPAQGADIFKIHVQSRKIVRLTNQRFSPNTGAARWAADYRTPPKDGHNQATYFSYGVYNMGPCPLPGGRIVFTSNRDGFRPSKGYPAVALQLFVMDDRDESIGADETPRNLEKIGHLNIAGALHPVVLADGRIMYTTLESQGLRSDILWGIWTIHPDGTNWNPLVSAFDPGGAPNGFHFQTELSDGSIVFEEYYNQNNSGFGAYIKLFNLHLESVSTGGNYPAFGPAYMRDPRNKPWRYGRFSNGRGKWYTMPFMPKGTISLTPFTHGLEGPADPAELHGKEKDENSPKVGKFTHPCGAPDNHLLTIYSPGPVNHQYTFLPQLDGGIYLIKKGAVVEEPAQMLLIKNDPDYNESWPRPLVPYERIYGVKEPARLPRLANDGKLSPHLPEGTPFGLVGTASLYKRESYPNGAVPPGKVTATYAGGNDPWKGLDPFTSHGNGPPLNFHNQGGDVGLFTNDDIHAIRILVQEPTTDRHRGFKQGRLFYNHASERLRILGEIPVRKFSKRGRVSAPSAPGADATGLAGAGASARELIQPLDPDGNPDTSFLARIPADTSFTFQTLDRYGMVLTSAQTWHQLRPGEIRNNCGGCHAHSQQATNFALTAAAKPDYTVWDLVNETPLITAKSDPGRVSAGSTRGADAAPLAGSRKQWDADDSTDVRVLKHGPLDVEYHRDIKPILARSCTACHTKMWKQPAGNLVLDADDEKLPLEYRGQFPGTYYRLALDGGAKFGHKPVGWDSWGSMQASRYIRKMQARRSLLAWKIFGRRLDGFTNDDHPSESKPGAGDLVHQGKPIDVPKNRHRADLDYTDSPMPPPDAVAGKYAGPEGKTIKVEPLSDEDRRTIVRWIDLGCPIDQDYEVSKVAANDSAKPAALPAGERDRGEGPSQQRGYGWFLDDNRPTLTIAEPAAGRNERLSRILIGAHDYYSGLDEASLRVTADFAVEGLAAGDNLAPRFARKTQGVWELKLREPIGKLPSGKLVVSVKDRRGNETRIEQSISIAQ
jgi:hypothetical protein